MNQKADHENRNGGQEAFNDAATAISVLKTAMLKFAIERDWLQFHSPKNLAMGLAIEAGELMEHFQWLTIEQSNEAMLDEERKEAIGEELADVVLYALQIANVCDFDLSQTVMSKLEKNAQKYPIDKARGLAKKYTEL